MTGGQEKNFSTLGPKLRDNRAQQYYGDKSLQIRVGTTNYYCLRQDGLKSIQWIISQESRELGTEFLTSVDSVPASCRSLLGGIVSN